MILLHSFIRKWLIRTLFLKFTCSFSLTVLLCSQCQTDSCTVFTGYGVEVMLRLLVSDGHCYLFHAKNPCPITSLYIIYLWNFFSKYLVTFRDMWTKKTQWHSQNHILNPRCHIMKLTTTLINKLATIFTIAKNYSQICLHLIILNHRLSYFFHCAFNKIVNSSI